MANRQQPKTTDNKSSQKDAKMRRTQERKERARKQQQRATEANRALRAEGKLTPYETRKLLNKARRDALRATGKLKPQPRNERGFIIETVEGRTVLRDPGNWSKRRNDRFNSIAVGATDSTEKRPSTKGRTNGR